MHSDPVVSRRLARLVIGGLVALVPRTWAASLDVTNPARTKREVTQRIQEMVRATTERDPELAQEMKRQKDLVIRELKHGRVQDERLTREIETFREIQREISGRVAEATEGRTHFEQVYKDTVARNPHEAAQLKDAFERVSRGEVVHPTTPDMMGRLLVEAERFITENPDQAHYARELAHRELERYRQKETGELPSISMKRPEQARQMTEQIVPLGHRPQETVKSHDLQNVGPVSKVMDGPKTSHEVERVREAPAREVERAHEAPAREVERVREAPVREIERVREVPVREVERVREAPVREIERVRETPTREVERVREAPAREVERAHEAPAREVERVREAPKMERPSEHPTEHPHDKGHDQHPKQEQKNSGKHP